MKIDLLELTRRILDESVRKPTAKDKAEHKSSHPNGGRLHYVVVSESGKRLGFIDAKYVSDLSSKEGKKFSPKGAAKRRLSQVEYFKGK